MKIVMSVGGSLIVPDAINYKFLQKFKQLILKHRTKKFVFVAGGGGTARKYMRIVNITDEDRDWLGIHATRLNAHLLRTIFRKQAYHRVIKDPNKKINTRKRIIIAAGWRPGRSTDYNAVLLAKNIGADTVVNLSDIDYVYDKDPKKYKNAKKLKTISWKAFRKIVGNKWRPGLNAPFDPIASKVAQKAKQKVVILNGKNLRNLDNFLKGKTFKGTVIGP